MSSRKKIIVVGGFGTIGKAVVSELEKRHEVIAVGHQSSNYQVEITSQKSIKELYQKIGKIDALVCAAGKVKFAPLNQMDDAAYQIGLQSKLMGQINLVLLGLDYMNDHGSFTLISGILSRDPIASGSSSAMVNGAIDGFVKAAALELPRGIRINSISPTILTESFQSLQEYFYGFKPVPAYDAALAFSKSVEGLQTGQTYIVG